MTFATAYSDHMKYDGVSIGSRFRTEHVVKHLANGGKVLVEKGVTNLDDYIQSFAEECDLNTLLNRFRATGDPSVLEVRKGAFGDFSDLPSTIDDVYEVMTEMSDHYEGLPDELKKLYPTLDSYLAAYNTPDSYNALVDAVNALSVDPVPVKEVKADVQSE